MLSIIIPAFNASSTIERCLNSVLNQDIQDWECLIVDDGSTDNTSDAIKEFVNRDSRFRYFYQENSGVAAARNFALSKITGDWVGFIDADDWIEPNRFSAAINAGTTSGYDVVQCAMKVHYPDKTKVWAAPKGEYNPNDGKILTSSLYSIGHSLNKIYRSYIFKDWGLRFPDCDLAEDLLMNALIYAQYGRLLVIDDVLYNYSRSNNESLSKKKLSVARRVKTLNAYESTLKFIKTQNAPDKYVKAFKRYFDNLIEVRLDKTGVDLVFPYVDCSKEDFKALISKYPHTDDIQEGNKCRFRAYEDLLKYLFRGIDKFAPWIDAVHMIVQSESQVPDWLDKSSIHIVTHDSIIPEQYLPTFNSSAIECWISQICGLAKGFVYGNDDMFFISHTDKSDFFDEQSMLPKLNWVNCRKTLDNTETVWFHTFNNAFNFIKCSTHSNTLLPADGNVLNVPHTILPYNRDLCRNLVNRYHREITKTITRFRNKINMNQYIYFWYHIMTGNYLRGSVNSVYSALQQNNVTRICNAISHTRLSNAPCKVICINDVGEDADLSDIKNAFDNILRNKCRFEI